MYATGIGLLIKGIQKAELVEESVVTVGAPVEKIKSVQKSKKGQGMFEWILLSGSKFIKDDIKDEDYTN
jgi:cell division protein FtsA